MRYLPVVDIKSKRYSLPLTREEVWCRSKSRRVTVENIGLYQPEEDGHIVVYVQKGAIDLIRSASIFIHVLLCV